MYNEIITIGYSCIIAGILFVLGIIKLSKQNIGLRILRASIFMAVPLLTLCVFYYFGFGFADDLLFNWPYQIPFLIILSTLSFIYSGFTKQQILLFLVFLIGFLLICVGLFLVVIIVNLRIGF